MIRIFGRVRSSSFLFCAVKRSISTFAPSWSLAVPGPNGTAHSSIVFAIRLAAGLRSNEQNRRSESSLNVYFMSFSVNINRHLFSTSLLAQKPMQAEVFNLQCATMYLIALYCATIAGACISIQAAANASLRTNLNDARWATFFSICGTIITGIIVMLIIRPAPPTAAAMRSAPWWNWIGGPLGALIVLFGAALTPRLGAAAFIAAIVAGQLASSILLDQDRKRTRLNSSHRH